jgi:signal peptidase
MSHNTLGVLALFLTIYIVLTLSNPRGIMVYALPSILWATLALITLYLTGGLQKIRQWTNNRITMMALGVAVFQIFILIDAGLINKFGKSPFSFTPVGIALNFMMVSTTLLGMELSRGYLTKNLSRKHPTLTIATVTLLYTFVNISISAITSLQTPIAYAEYIGENLLPTLTENLLATYLALMSGPLASLAYRAPLQAFHWFCPIQPDLPWGYKSIIGVMVPTISFMAINIAAIPRDLRKAGFPTKIISTPKQRKSQKSIKGWLAISAFLVLIVWASTGLLGFYPTIIASGSMTPTLNPGDIAIVIATPPKTIKIGDIIQYQTTAEAPTIHRVIDKYESAGLTWFITQGDANNAPDDPINERQITGKVILTIPKLGWISIYLKEFFASAYTFITTTLPNTITESGTFILKNGIYITTALTLTAYSYLLLTYKNQKGGGKNE